MWLNKKKVASMSDSGETPPPPITTEFSLRSTDNTSNPSGSVACSYALTTACFIATATPGVISLNDVVYTVSGGPFVFDANNNYYLLQIQSGAMLQYVCQINGSGVITDVHETCPI